MEDPFEKAERALGELRRRRDEKRLEAWAADVVPLLSYIAVMGPVSPSEVIEHMRDVEQSSASEAQVFRILRCLKRLDIIDFECMTTDLPPVIVAGCEAPVLGYVVRRTDGGEPVPDLLPLPPSEQRI